MCLQYIYIYTYVYIYNTYPIVVVMTDKSDIHPGRCRTAVPSQAPSCGSRSWRATNCSPDSAQVDHSHKRNTRKCRNCLI